MKKINLRVALVICLILGIFGVLIYTAATDHVMSSATVFPEYHNLFSKNAQGKLKILRTAKSKSREPVSTYLFDNKYNVCVVKVPLSRPVSLDKLITLENASSYINMNAVYAQMPSSKFELNLRTSNPEVASTVNFKCKCDTIKTIIKNDSLLCYYYKFKTFSISYNEAPYDLIASSNQNFSLPASIMFIKRSQFLYVVLLTIANGNEEMKQDLLYSIIKD